MYLEEIANVYLHRERERERDTHTHIDTHAHTHTHTHLVEINAGHLQAAERGRGVGACFQKGIRRPGAFSKVNAPVHL